MADVNVSPAQRAADPPAPPQARSIEGAPAAPLVDIIELLFFAYRNFVSDPDEILARYGFGRAHHRVLHFVHRHPGMRVTDLLDILRITKQSLGRVLRELVDQGFIDSRAGSSDRRQRLLYLTPKGEALARDFIALQSARIERALAECAGPDGRMADAKANARRFLVSMIDAEDRGPIEKLIARAESAADPARAALLRPPARPRGAG
ncbi:MarR family transcriptional regulator [Ancylobacter sp. 6x-1]|uniref:MarR family transcriptional regulator n=1 Tax=Ancylobacter crimeensis TaxID=2579147 RepID=A0ABT0D9R4_9HYPH|nr:MarR family transcriptional regulator [Ancylobacter crimeensis]MCK0196687.1 MarR family transcriptional regulator [Ancylobacter crimeensis]